MVVLPFLELTSIHVCLSLITMVILYMLQVLSVKNFLIIMSKLLCPPVLIRKPHAIGQDFIILPHFVPYDT